MTVLNQQDVLLHNLNTVRSGYRADINGLRAIAVIAVVLFHFGVDGFSGGFSGVDIFFVISGFLMTSIIFRQIDNVKFSLLGFYLSRAKRIIPALAVLCLALLVGGWFLLIPSDYKELGKHAASSIAFLSNLIYWKEAGYFNTSSHEKWMLHTWSLSVEWQFYIVYPLIILAARKVFSFSATRSLLLALAIGSFLLCLQASKDSPNTAFYMLPTRAWEMIVGGLIYLFPIQMKQKYKQFAGAIGLMMIGSSVFFLESTDIWPGWLALIPVVGTAIIVCAADQKSIIINNKFSGLIGDASYSIYLWHWPIVVLIGYYDLNNNTAAIAGGIAASLALGFASLNLVEKPCRNLGMMQLQLPHLACYVVAVVVVGALGATVFVKRGIESRVPDNVAAADREGSNRNPESKKCFVLSGSESPKCIFGDPGYSIGAIVIGDSHSDAIVSAVVEAAGPARPTLFLGYISCLTIPNMKLQGENHEFKCGDYVKRQIDELSKSHAGVPLIVINRTSVYVLGHNEYKDTYAGPLMYFDEPVDFNQAYKEEFKSRYISAMCKLAENRPVYTTKPIPEMGKNVPATISRNLMKYGHSEDIRITVKEYHDRHKFVASVMDEAVEKCGIKLLDPEPWLCDKEHCHGSINKKPLYYDDDHLSEYGNKFLVPMFKSVWN